ncbi:MAG TPA: TolC family protein, partial [Armatimonadota bacterium]|nr:TolC family protein [Armatimonadota bacterium]
EQVARARGQVSEAASAGHLQADVSGNLTRVDEVSTISLGGNSVKTGKLYTRTANLSLTQPIDISGALRASRDIASYGETQAILALAGTREKTVLDVKTAYFQVLRAQAAFAVAQATATSLEEHERQSQAFYKNGVAAQYDVLRAEAQLANAQQAVIAARNGVELAKAAMNNVLGIDVTTPITVSTEPKLTRISPNYRESLNLAYTRRLEVQEALAGVQAAERGIDLARSGRLPNLAIAATGSYNMDPTLFNSRKSAWNAAAVLSFPLLDGGQARARIRQAEADTNNAQIAEEQVRESIALEMQQAILTLNNAGERLDAAEKNLTQAKEAARLAKVRYQAGVSTAIEVTDSQAVLTEAETNAVNARYDYLLAQASYEHAVGPEPATK